MDAFLTPSSPPLTPQHLLSLLPLLQPNLNPPSQDMRDQILILRHPSMNRAFQEAAVPITPQNQLGQCEMHALACALPAGGVNMRACVCL